MQLDSTSVGAKTGQIVINSNDASEASFAFEIQGLVNGNDSDFNNDGNTDGADFLAWQRGFGITSGAQKSDGDATREGVVNGADLAVWESEFGTVLVAASTGVSVSSLPTAAVDVVLRLAAIDNTLEIWPAENLFEQNLFDQQQVRKYVAQPLSEAEEVADNSIRTSNRATDQVLTRADAIVDALIRTQVVDHLSV